MNNGHRVPLHPISAAATALILTLACVADASAQAAPSGGGRRPRAAAPPAAPAAATGAPAVRPTVRAHRRAVTAASVRPEGGTLGGPSDPNPYYIGVSQAFIHDTNVYRIPYGPGDTYSVTSLLGGFDQMIGRQHVFGRAVVSGNRYQDETTLNNTSYSVYTASTGRRSNISPAALTARSTAASRRHRRTPARRWRRKTSRTRKRSRRSFAGAAPPCSRSRAALAIRMSAIRRSQYVASEFNQSSVHISLFYHGGGPFRVGIGVRGDATRTPQAFVDPATGQVQSTR